MEPSSSAVPHPPPDPGPVPVPPHPHPTPPGTSPSYLVTRSDDLVLFAVTFDGFTRSAGPTPDGSASYTAGIGAYLQLTLPPQALAEQRFTTDDALPSNGFAASVGAGTSALLAEVPAGTVVPATVEGVLTTLATLGIDPTSPGTALELPTGLVIAPVPAVTGESLTAHHPVTPRRQDGTTALWQSELRAPSGLAALPRRAAPAGNWTGALSSPTALTAAGPLWPADAGAIVAAAQAGSPGSTAELPRVDRLQVSALGGTLRAHGAWADLAWQQDTALGRDRRVQVSRRGVLLPFGHTALLVETAERTIVDSADGGLALVRASATLYIDPVRVYPTDDELARHFPFERVDVLVSTVAGLLPTEPAGSPPHITPQRLGPDGETIAVQFPVRLYGSNGPVDVTMPLLFLGTATTPNTVPGVHAHDAPLDPGLLPPDGLTVGPVDVPAARIDLVRAATPRDGDVHLIHGLELDTVLDAAGGTPDWTSYRPRLTGLTVDLPALRAMLPTPPTLPTPPGLPAPANHLLHAVLNPDLLARGEQASAVLGALTPLGSDGRPLGSALVADFSGAAEQTGALVTPSFVADAVSRTLGPVKQELLDAVDQARAVGADVLRSALGEARLLGLKLVDLIADGLAPLPVPTLTEVAQAAAEIAAGKPPTARLAWSGLPLKSAASFVSEVATGVSTLDLTATVGPDTRSITCTVHPVHLALPSASSQLLTLSFGSVQFTAAKGQTPKLAVHDVKADFGGGLAFLEGLQDFVDLGGAGQIVKALADSITASYAFTVPSASCGVIGLADLDFRSSVVVPYDDRTVSVAVSFASREHPFTVTVLSFGGGGYLDLLLDGHGLQHFEGSLDFGAQLGVDFVIARGEVHAFGGVSFTIVAIGDPTKDGISVTAFLRFGGSLQVLGVVTVSLEVSIELHYTSSPNQLSGCATLVIDVDVTVWSDSVELDTGTWVIAGGSSPPSPNAVHDNDPDPLAAWTAYRTAFAA